MTLAGAEIGEYMESMEMRPALPESNGFPAAFLVHRRWMSTLFSTQ